MGIFYSPQGNPEVWADKPKGYFTREEWEKDNPQPDPAPITDIRPPEEKRQAAYVVEADPFFWQAQYYQAEAEGLRLMERVAEADEAEATARGYLRQYAEKKLEIRARFSGDAMEGDNE